MIGRGSGVRDGRYLVGAAAPERLRWDLVQVALAIVLFTQIWRTQELFPVLAIPGLPILASLGAVLVWALDRDRRRRLSGVNQPVVRAALGILILVALSIPGSLYQGASVNFLLKDFWRTIALLVLIAASVRGLADLRRLAWLHLAGVTLFSLFVVARSEISSDGRLNSVEFYDVNDLATLIVCTLPLVLYLWQPAGLRARLLLATATVLLMMTLVQTGSRGGLVGLLAVAAYLLVRFRAISKAKRAGAVALLAILLVAVANDRYFERMQTLVNPSSDYNWSGKDEVGRMEIWKRGIGYMLSHPLFGVGARSFPVAEGTLSPQAVERKQYGRGFKWSAAHNSFVEIGAELGVLGLVLFVTLLVGAFRALSRVQRGPAGEAAFLAQALTGCLVGFVATAIFLSQAYSAYFYALLGMSVGLARIARPMRAPLARFGSGLPRAPR